MRFLALLLLIFLRSAYGLTTADYISSLSTMEAYFATNTASIATTVRLAFHDCVGGCNGCINTTQGDNAGLADLVTALDTEYTSNGFDAKMTKADFWALSSIAAINQGITLANRGCPRNNRQCNMPLMSITFKTGRVDCDPATVGTNTFPSPKNDRATMMSFFNTNFGFSEAEVTALMGAHTLGDAQRDASGYRGPWVVGSGGMIEFDNRFYKNMFETASGTPTITYVKVNAVRRPNPTDDQSRWQWDGSDGSMMLNTDFELLYDVSLNTASGEPSCDLTSGSATFCPQATSTYSLVQSYANDAATWLTDFTSVFTKMIEHGSSNLVDLDP